MGAANSREPRSVSMDNPTPPSSVIDVSDEVVQRLKAGIKKQARENAEKPVTPSKPAPSPKPEKRSERVVPVKPTPPVVAPTPAPKAIYAPPPVVYVQPGAATLTALEVKRQMETELKNSDAMWRQRMQQLEETLKKTNEIMEKEFAESVENVKNRFATAAPSHQLPPCQDLKSQVIACYRANPGETLKCSAEVANFRNCIGTHRVQKLDAQAGGDAGVAKAG